MQSSRQVNDSTQLSVVRPFPPIIFTRECILRLDPLDGHVDLNYLFRTRHSREERPVFNALLCYSYCLIPGLRC